MHQTNIVSRFRPRTAGGFLRIGGLCGLWLLPLLLFYGTTLASEALDREITLDIEANTPLEDALITWGTASGLTVMMNTSTTHNRVAPAVRGHFTARTALTALLQNSGLSYTEESGRVHIVPTSTLRSSILAESRAPASPSSVNSDFQSRPTDIEGEPPDETRLAHTPEDSGEVIVTAQKRVERLQDVPVPVTAIGADTLIESSQASVEDYYSRIPGLSVTPADRGAPIVSIRGIASGAYSNPTVGVVIDDVPFGASTLYAFGEQIPDFDPSDLARIEVLRGPQGTLYGVSSLGGLLKYVTIDPSTDNFSGQLQASGNDVYNGAQLGYGVRGTVNMPLSDALAVRASAFTRANTGYIDDPVHGLDGVNRGGASGGRLAALWKPSNAISLKLTALFQHTDTDGSSHVDAEPGLGDLQQDDTPGTGWVRKNLEAYSAVLNAKLGLIDLTSLTGYSVSAFKDAFDYTTTLGRFSQKEFGETGTSLFDDIRTNKVSQELRLSASLGPSFEGMLGLFYTHEGNHVSQSIIAENFTNGAFAGSWEHDYQPSTYEEYAAFADLTYHFTDQFDVQIGDRESENRQTYSEATFGPYNSLFVGLPDSFVYPQVDSRENSFTYLVTPRFKVNPDFMVYARLASGFRAGGPNINASAFGAPSHFDPDTTQNYELGAKTDLFAHTLTLDTSVYYIDWKSIQLLLFDAQRGGYFANAGRAKSEGVEFSVEARPGGGLTLSSWIAWNEAELTEGFPPTSTAYGVPGNRLPYSARVSGSFSFTEELPIRDNLSGFFGSTVSYTGDREGQFSSTAQRQDLPGYARTDATAGFHYRSWEGNLFVNNLTDRRGLLDGGIGSFNPVAFVYIQPRTIGISVKKMF